ncbi:MAG: lytic transglycosylase domain-containing protein [Patescibacteria group bacterium]
MYGPPVSVAFTRRRRRAKNPFWLTALKWLGCIAFSPGAVLYEILTGRNRLKTIWVRSFLVLGMILLLLTGSAVLADQAAERDVFAALNSFAVPDRPVPAAEPYAAEINAAASRYHVNPMAVLYIIRIESGCSPLRVSPRGARGLMQIMPATWRMLNPDGICRGNHPPPACPAGADCIFAPWGNIRAGTLYLSRLLKAYHGDYIAALQAYNAGGRHVVEAPEAKYLETRRYVASFMRYYRELQRGELSLRLEAVGRMRRLAVPLLFALACYTLLATVFFWSRHRQAA